MRSVELFAGAGGLGMGISEAGFEHEVVIERDKYACDTIRENQIRGVHPVVDWPLYEGDATKYDYSVLPEGLDLLSGGPPCQPFSLGGKHAGHTDERNMFPEVVRAVRVLKPKAVIVENVKGLLRQSFAKYYEYIRLQITYPDIIRNDAEDWNDHQARLEQYHTGGTHEGLCYRVLFRLLNAADFGVPQKRERVFIVAFRSDVAQEWSFPNPTHSHDRLLWDQWVSGEYWERQEVAKSQRPEPSPRLRDRINALKNLLLPPPEQAWRTVRDAIEGLPDPQTGDYSETVPNHKHNPGARSYKGHTGSPLDEPAKTLKAGDHGVPGGENTVAFMDGRIRYFTVRECARLQTFPNNYVFPGAWTECMRQLGNAVPVTLATTVAKAVRRGLENNT